MRRVKVKAQAEALEADLEVAHQYQLVQSQDQPIQCLPAGIRLQWKEHICPPKAKHYSVVFDVLRAVQYGAVFSPCSK